MVTHNFGSNYTLAQIKDIINYGKGYVCELHREVAFDDDDWIIFDGINKKFKEWREIVGASTSISEMETLIGLSVEVLEKIDFLKKNLNTLSKAEIINVCTAISDGNKTLAKNYINISYED